MTLRRICLWSGPRTVSTPVMYAFAQRDDTRVLDEPLYAHYLQRTGAPHPGREQVIASYDACADRVISEQFLGHYSEPVLFIKCMTHHLVGLELDFLSELTHVLLIRHPREVLSSLASLLPQPGLLDTACQMQWGLFNFLQQRGRTPLVIDARTLLEQPEAVLRHICAVARIPFQPAMLQWSPGGRADEGIWGAHAYGTLHQTGGFLPYQAHDGAVPEPLAPLLEVCEDYYLRLLEYAYWPQPAADPIPA